MKTKFFLMFASAAMLLAACSKDDIGSGGDDSGVVTDPKGKAWVALDIKTPSVAGTRALHKPEDKEDGSSEESTVQTVGAIFFDAAEEVTEDITLTAAEAGNPGQPSGGVSDPFEVDATSKRILIVANPGADFPASFAQGIPYSTVNAALTVSDADVAGNVAADGNFMMSNSKGRLEPSASATDGTDVDLKLYKTKELASASPLAINIDRVVAKVRVYVEEISNVATISEPSWVLNVTNTKFFPVSERTLTWNENPSNGNDARGTCITPFDQYKIGSYRVDPNYNTSDNSDYKVINDDIEVVNAPGSSQYCLENTQEEEFNQHQYTTQVLLKVKFVPNTYGRPNTTDMGTPDGDGDWMRINGGFIPSKL